VSPLLRVAHRLSRAAPGLAWRIYSARARAAGLRGVYVILSFDCDTPEDAEAAEALHDALARRAIKATYAVPGAMLQQAKGVYCRLAERGAVFINHGAKPHTEFRDGRYWSINFYDRMALADVATDIRSGHEIVAAITGRAPDGFRAPHFGTFQHSAQLAYQHQVLRELGYRFSTSTIPAYAFLHGPVWWNRTLPEVPVSGSLESPLGIFDSWTYARSPKDPRVTTDYEAGFRATLSFLLDSNLPAVLNYYADPSHVWDTPAFQGVMDVLSESAVRTLHFRELLDLVGHP